MNGKDINKRDEHNPRHHHYAECSKDKQEQYNGQQYQQFDNRGDQLRRMDDTRIVQDKKKKAYGVHFSNSHYVFDSTFLPPVSLLPPLQTPSFSTANMPTAHECFPQSDLNEIGPRQTNGSKKCSGVEEVRETKETKEIKEIKGIKESKNIDLLKKDPTTRFQILEKLGSGSSGSSIFKALDRLDGMKPVALKKIPLLTLSDSLESNVPAQADVDAFINSIAYHNEDWGQGGDEVVREEYITDDGGDNSKSKIRQEGTRCLDRQPSNNWPISSMIASKIARKKGYNQVMKCQDCFLIGSELWLLLEFCAGGSVADLIRLSDGPLTESEIGWIMSQVLQGLTFLHSKDHVHGDIKAGNILLTMDGQVKLGGSGTVLNHKEGAGERKRRRRSLAMTEFPVSWLAPELNNSAVCCPSVISGTRVKNCPLGHDNTNNNTENPNSSSWTPRASTETDIWALGIACIELSQGRPPRPEMLLLAMLDEQKPVSHQQIALSSPAFDIVDRLGGIKFGGIGLESGSRTPGWESLQSTASSANESLGAVGLGMSEEMRSFIAKCLTPDPRTRPNVYDLLQDPFIIQNQGGSAELVERIQQMMEFVNQCASISSEMPLHLHNQHQSLPLHASSSLLPTVGSSASAAANSTSALTLSLSKASLMIDMDLDEASIGPWLIPMVRPRVDSVYDASSFFDQSGLPIAPPEPSTANHISHWKHQRVSHPVVKQALMCDQAGYMIFRHSRSPSLATIVESHLEDDSCSCNSTSIKDFECNTTNSSGNSSYNSNNGTGLHRIGSDDLKIDYGDNG
ncbi:kinase-like domain-containing protein, partial [Lobosporangium transversale]